jgi:hypothetical protein
MKTILMALLIAVSLQANDPCRHALKNMKQSIEGMMISGKEHDGFGFRQSKSTFLFWNKKVILICEGDSKAMAKNIRKDILEIGK